MMKRILTILALVAMTIGNLVAGNVSQQLAQCVGQQFLGSTMLGQGKAGIQLQMVSTAATRGEVDYYVFNVRGGGFVIIAGDDRVKPILAYSTTGSFDPEDVAEGFEFMLNSFRSEIQYVREHNLAATPDIVAEWESVLSTGSLQQGRQARAVVGPLCQTIWNQNFPWNSQCPEDPEGNGGHVYAGCVATAMGQVMKYWDYPERGTGSHTYNPDGYAQQTANFGETDYHFELMPLALDSTSTEEDYFYIAQFLHHCGIAVDMQYSGHGSGAYSFYVPVALESYFGYSCDSDLPTLSFYGYSLYTNEQWAQMLKDGGLDENLPLYYSGSDDNGAGGHAFVCDGYDENDYFHFNWGWSGRDDAWCPIGALNTTKYAFNDSNSFLGHIVPQNSSYYLRADSVAEFTVSEHWNYDGVMLNWENPSLNLNGQPLNSIDSILIRRNNQPLVTLYDVQRGEAMSYVDGGLAPGLYEYSISVCNSVGVSRKAYRTILVGEKCEITFNLQDEGGDGWKGAAISVADENGARIAVITMTEGSEQTVTVPLLKDNLNFIWNHGWYHTTEQYDTDYECSFTIMDAEGNVLYTSSDLEDGIFLTYNNDCEEAPLVCYPARELKADYVWYNGEEYGALLAWDEPEVTARLDRFIIYREELITKEYEPVAEVLYTGATQYEYFDNLKEFMFGGFDYQVTCVFANGDDSCESDPDYTSLYVTDVNENANADVKVYPNPTSGQLHVVGEGTMTVSVYNMLGQEVLRTETENQATMDLSLYGSGIYMVRIETANGIALQKVSVNR